MVREEQGAKTPCHSNVFLGYNFIGSVAIATGPFLDPSGPDAYYHTSL